MSFFKLIIIASYLFFYTLFLECDKTIPILKNNQCVSTYCTKEEFDTGECIINEPITKTKWLNSIITFENTNGDIYLAINSDRSKFIFGTTLSNNEDRIYFGLMSDSKERRIEQIFNYNDKFFPYIIKNINRNENKELINPEICFISLKNKEYIISIGVDNSSIELLSIDNYMNDYLLISPTDFFDGDIIIKGVTSYFLKNNEFIYIAVTYPKNDTNNYYLSFYHYKIDSNEQYSLISKQYLEDIGNKFASCFFLNKDINLISCIYLGKDNKYKINLIKNGTDTGVSFELKQALNIGRPSTIDENHFYFLKGALYDSNKGLYCYYSGDSDDIPTFLNKEIEVDDTNFTIKDLYSEFPIINLYDYSFNNDVNYNDLVIFDNKDFYFVSTNKNLEFLIIAYLKFYQKDSTQNGLFIRYYTIKLQEFYNIKIFNTFKVINFNREQPYLILALDFCYYDSCQNSDSNINNAGLIIFSYLNKTSDAYIDFIEYGLNYNKNDVVVNFTENFRIENNIFGFKFSYMMIIETTIEESIKYYDINNKYYKNMENEEELFLCMEDSLIRIELTDYSLKEIKIEYILQIQTPENANEYDEYFDNYNNTYGDLEGINYKNTLKTSDTSSYIVNITQDLTNECNDINCALCLKNDINYCIICINDNYTIIENKKYKYGKKKICSIDENQNHLSDIESSYNEQIISTDNLIDSKSVEDFLNGKNKETNLSNNDMKDLYKELKKYISNNYDGKDTIINTGNVKVQMSTIDSQKDSEELSNVDLGECAEILKDKYCKANNQSLIMLKFDIKPENETSTYVQYEIYEPNSKLFLELKECTGTNVVINVPIELNSEIESLYDMLAKSGYNLFDANDSFYNDICAVYTTENDTDILLYDRRMDIYQLTINISLCQDGCQFKSYNLETKKAECECPVQTEETKLDISNLEFNKNEMLDEFYETLQNSNFRVLICYKLVYNLKVFIKNIGSIIMTILFALFLTLMIVYIFISSKKVNLYIQSIIKKKYLENDNKNKQNENENENKNKVNNNNSNNSNNNNNNNSNNNNIYSNNLNSNDFLKSKKRKKNKKKKTVSFSSKHNTLRLQLGINNISSPPRRHNYKRNTNLSNGTSIKRKVKISISNNALLSNNIPLKLNDNDNITFHTHVKYENDNTKEGIIQVFNKEVKTDGFHKEEENNTKRVSSTNDKDKNSNTELEKNKEEIDKKELNDQEMNSLDYENAIELDKRTYFQYYISLLKKKHLILFTFIPANDYNLISLKISLFLVSFCLYLCINAFFFNDDTMHKIYKDSGVFNILYQIPQIIYSSVVSSIINILLKILSLSEKDILKIKEEKDIKITVTKSKNVEKCIKIKFVIFFIFSLLLMLFFWYFISCFCAVYNNTQTILIKDTLISFSLSMLYPFGLNLLPGLFRIPALRAEKKDKICLYSFSKLIALI